MTSSEMRNNILFLRNNFETVGKWNIPLIRKQNIDTENIKLIAYPNTRANDSKRKKNAVFIFLLTIIALTLFTIILKNH